MSRRTPQNQPLSLESKKTTVIATQDVENDTPESMSLSKNQEDNSDVTQDVEKDSPESATNPGKQEDNSDVTQDVEKDSPESTSLSRVQNFFGVTPRDLLVDKRLLMNLKRSPPDIDHINNIVCEEKRPYLCPPYGMCYGYDQFCSNITRTVTDCLPKTDKDADLHCQELKQGNRTLSDPACKYACLERFPNKQNDNSDVKQYVRKHSPKSIIISGGSLPTIDQLENIVCGEIKPYKCLPYGVCYGYDQFCSSISYTVGDCLPKTDEDANLHCQALMRGNGVLTDPACKYACLERFPNIGQGDNSDVTQDVRKNSAESTTIPEKQDDNSDVTQDVVTDYQDSTTIPGSMIRGVMMIVIPSIRLSDSTGYAEIDVGETVTRTCLFDGPKKLKLVWLVGIWIKFTNEIRFTEYHNNVNTFILPHDMNTGACSQYCHNITELRSFLIERDHCMTYTCAVDESWEEVASRNTTIAIGSQLQNNSDVRQWCMAKNSQDLINSPKRAEDNFNSGMIIGLISLVGLVIMAVFVSLFFKRLNGCRWIRRACRSVRSLSVSSPKSREQDGSPPPDNNSQQPRSRPVRPRRTGFRESQRSYQSRPDLHEFDSRPLMGERPSPDKDRQQTRARSDDDHVSQDLGHSRPSFSYKDETIPLKTLKEEPLPPYASNQNVQMTSVSSYKETAV